MLSYILISIAYDPYKINLWQIIFIIYFNKLIEEAKKYCSLV